MLSIATERMRSAPAGIGRSFSPVPDSGDRRHLGGAPLRGVDLCGIGRFDCRFHGAKAAMQWRRPTEPQRGGTMLAQGNALG